MSWEGKTGHGHKCRSESIPTGGVPVFLARGRASLGFNQDADLLCQFFEQTHEVRVRSTRCESPPVRMRRGQNYVVVDKADTDRESQVTDLGGEAATWRCVLWHAASNSWTILCEL